ncbi:hypothetical protein BpHYR1_001671 [Brachionus plicatilis]|uniref:Uncharacterized protein n=1 Tax=Brachionus plicatilis TaxID=10195 RepID=A0A3M7P9S4_BRAPC|nr:hypothetical protein BpHYR1_001671 [Brachionus plicatilis]
MKSQFLAICGSKIFDQNYFQFKNIYLIYISNLIELRFKKKLDSNKSSKNVFRLLSKFKI